MSLECCKNLVALKEEELKNCNGGSIITALIKKLLPPIIVIIPFPDPDSDGHL